MFIQSVKTPNPNAIKFFPGGVVMTEGVYDFVDKESAKSSQLAAELFAIPGVTQVFYGNDFISVTKNDDIDWNILKPQVIMAILNNYVEGQSLFSDDNKDGYKEESNSFADDPLAQKIIELLDRYVIPRLEADGGYVEFKSHKEGVVFLKMRGACSTCPSASMTLKNGIKSLLMAWIPEITDVESVS